MLNIIFENVNGFKLNRFELKRKIALLLAFLNIGNVTFFLYGNPVRAFLFGLIFSDKKYQVKIPYELDKMKDVVLNFNWTHRFLLQ